MKTAIRMASSVCLGVVSSVVLCVSFSNAQEADPSPSDLPAAENAQADDVISDEYDSGKRCGSKKGSDCGTSLCGCSSCCVPDEPWAIPQPCILQQMGIKIGGWLQQGATFNQHNPANGFNGVLGTNDWDDRWQMNQMWMWAHRPADNGGCGWAIGGHVDIMFGSDFRFGVNHGLEDRINGANQNYGTVIPQAYLEVAYNKLSVKMGHMAAILDYEAVPAPMNPFYSHSYSYAYTVPQLVTGVLGEYKLTDQLSLQAGMTRGWFMFEDFNNNWDFMGGIKWTSCDKKTSIAWAMNQGPQDPGLALDWNSIPGDQDRFVYSLVVQRQVTEKLKWVGVHNLGIEQNWFLGPGDDAEWYGLNQYLLYTINPCWQANMRLEILRDDDGAKVAGPGNYAGIVGPNNELQIAANPSNFHVGNFVELTLGLNWRPSPNWLIRPEVRWDWFDLDGPLGPTGLPFDAGDRSQQFTFAADAVFTF